uniref:Thioredoxin domain-containing protein n=1 Tax=Alexandrium monilatum TaxID=311494 RepID=A0A7S4V430_9DINO
MASMRAALLVAFAAVAQAVELTEEDWDAKTAGKTVFVKFYAPWCGHCKSMKPAWDELMAEFEGHKTILVADVDCIGDGKSICDKIGVEGFPTIKHGDPSNLEDYEGERELEALKEFASNLKPMCSPSNLDLCDEEGKKKIGDLMALSDDDLDAKIQELDDVIAEADKTFEAEVEELQKRYEELSTKKEEAVKAVKASGHGLMKAVRAAKAKKAGSDEL